MSDALPQGSLVRLEKPALQGLLDRLKGWGYRVLGPTVSQAAVIYGDLALIDEMPVGYSEDQEAGQYRLKQTGSGRYFDYVVGPHSMKNFLFLPRTTVMLGMRVNGQWRLLAPEPPREKLAFIGVRSCDLHALRIQDRVFAGPPAADPDYQQRRADLFVLAVNCARSAPTCFCASMNTGPAVTAGADLVLTEFADFFTLEVGSPKGAESLAGLPWRPCTDAEVSQVQEVPRQASRQQKRRLDRSTVHDELMNNLEHPRWDEVATRCLSCTNCTLVCPTCFCSAVEEVTDLAGDQVQRERVWDSCFTDEHSYVVGGSVRKSTKARYRQWLTHKLATWIDQFGTSGCVGCGRCITWCPVGIDLTEEVAAIRGGVS
jgi:ferredoxin